MSFSKKFIVPSVLTLSILGGSIAAYANQVNKIPELSAHTTEDTVIRQGNANDSSTGLGSEIDEKGILPYKSREDQAKELLSLYSWAEKENYEKLPKPPVGNWRLDSKRIYLTDEEVRNIPVKGIPYGEAGYTDDQGRVYTIVGIAPPKEVIDWISKYNAKIPGYNAPGSKVFESPVEPLPDNDSIKEASQHIYNNIKAYENWIFGE